MTEQGPAAVAELVRWARGQLGSSETWKIVGARTKLAKTLFEVDAGGRLIVGKTSTSERMQRTFETQRRLWEAGMCPPSRFIVTEPIAWLPERHLLLQSKAEGTQLHELIHSDSARAIGAARAAADWLRAIQSLPFNLHPAPSRAADVERCSRELTRALPPDHAATVRAILDEVAPELDREGSLVPSHGDYHPMNLFLSDGGRLTAIDLDVAAARRADFDVTYFVAQVAIMGFNLRGSFQATAGLRSTFLANAPAPCNPAELRWAFLRALHYDLCILKIGDRAHVQPFLEAASHGLP